MKKIILAFLITVMLSSCTFRTKAFYLEADSVAVAYIADRHTAVKINIDEETLAFLRAESSLEGQALFEDIFSYAPESYQLISDEDYMLRQNIFTSLREISGSTDTLHAFSAFAGDLRKTDFTATINKLSSDFDDTFDAPFSAELYNPELEPDELTDVEMERLKPKNDNAVENKERRCMY